jgi:hypothetical protein
LHNDNNRKEPNENTFRAGTQTGRHFAAERSYVLVFRTALTNAPLQIVPLLLLLILGLAIIVLLLQVN